MIYLFLHLMVMKMVQCLMVLLHMKNVVVLTSYQCGILKTVFNVINVHSFVHMQ